MNGALGRKSRLWRRMGAPRLMTLHCDTTTKNEVAPLPLGVSAAPSFLASYRIEFEMSWTAHKGGLHRFPLVCHLHLKQCTVNVRSCIAL